MDRHYLCNRVLIDFLGVKAVMFDQMAQWSYKSQIQMQNQKLMERDYIKQYKFRQVLVFIDDRPIDVITI